MNGGFLHRFPASATVLAALLLCAPAAGGGSAEIVFRGGRVYTVDPARPVAQAVAVSDGRIVYVGDSAGVVPWVGKKTRVVELAEGALYPGFVDAHARLLDYARANEGLDLSGTRSAEEALRRVARAARAAGPHAWVVGWGWNQEEWVNGRAIQQEEIAAVTGDHPLCLHHATDRAIIANRVSLGLAEFDRDMPDPPGGRALRTARGGPTGILADAAADFITREMPRPDPSETARLYRAAAESCLARGITRVHEMGVSPEALAGLKKAAETREGLPLRIEAILLGTATDLGGVLAGGPVRKPLGGRLTVRGVLVPADGGLCTRGAALSRPYQDEADWTGYLRYPPEALAARVREVMKAGFQPVIEASGDAGVGAALDALEAARDTLRGGADLAALRPRIEKAVCVSAADLPRFRSLGVVASMQPARMPTDCRWIENRLGPNRLRGVHAWKSLLGAGVPLAFGSDCPGGPPDPVGAFHAAITRRSVSGRPAGGWMPEEKLTREEALAALTRDAAYAGFDEAEAGTIRVGARADLTVLSRDIMRIPEQEISAARTLMTVVDGRIVYERLSPP